KRVRVGERLGQCTGRWALDIRRRGGAGGGFCRSRGFELVGGSANGGRIAAGRKLRGGEAESARLVADHGDGGGRAFALGAYDDSFHGPLGGGADLTGERRRRLRAGGNSREHSGDRSGGESARKKAPSPPRPLHPPSPL